jgi:hypothetical protein
MASSFVKRASYQITSEDDILKLPDVKTAMLLKNNKDLNKDSNKPFQLTFSLVLRMMFSSGLTVVVKLGLLLSANSTIFQLYHGENKLIFNEMMKRSALR